MATDFDPSLAAPPFDEYLGYYAEDAQSRYQAVIRDGDVLALETPGKRIRQLVYAGEDLWKFQIKPGVFVAFDRDAEERVAFDSRSIWYASLGGPAQELMGDRAGTMRRDNLLADFGDWRDWFPTVEVVQRIRSGDRDLLLVRMGDTSAPASTYYIDWTDGRLVRIDSMPVVEGMGRIGKRLVLGDYREVAGMLLPFHMRVDLMNPLIGTITSTVTDVELGPGVEETSFSLADLK